jgi:arabinogalactan endo-1,4-beta-galactosidase
LKIKLGIGFLVVALVMLIGCAPATSPSSSSPDLAVSASVTTGTTGLAIGADVSEIVYAQNKGVTYYDTTGTSGDGMQILYNHGYKWARVRVNVSPTSTNYAMFTDLAYAATVGAKAKAMGYKLLIDFHYSHWWADPSNQWTPDGVSSSLTWSKTSISTLKTQVYNWTKSAMTTLVSAGATPDMVQVGNEITNGLLWPLGGPYQSGGSWANMAALINQGISAVKAVNSSTKIMLHLDSGGSWSTTYAWIKYFIANSGNWSSVDAMGFSYYPMWQGSFTNLKAVLAGMKSYYSAKQVWIAETAWYWKTSEAGYSSSTYASTPAGQYAFLRALVDVLDDYSNVAGVFYWGAGWTEASKWLVATGWSNDDAGCRGLFNASGVATTGIDGL